jgi:hypothetical protein
MTERRNVTQPADWWAAFEAEAKKEGLTLSEWVGACCVANLSVSRGLTERPPANRPKKPRDEGR